jgi:hypothetical protein
MKKLFNLLIKFIQKLLFVEWSGYDLNHKSINYIVGHYRLYELIKDVPGHIIELGTGSGRNSLIFGSIIKLNNQAKYKHVYGFDTFSGYPKNVLESNKHFDSKAHTSFSFDDVKLRMLQNNLSDVVNLIKGSLPQSLEDFLDKGIYSFSKEGLKISLIYVDCNDYETAKNSLMILKKYLSKGAVIAIDENKLGGETKALDFLSNAIDKPIIQWKSGGVISSYIII